jgi:prevent-host-death family protein
MEILNSYEAKTQLSRLIDRALAGERIVIARAGRPLVELTPYRPMRPRQGGRWKGKVRMSRDFDAPLPEIERAIYGDDAAR